MTTKQQVILQHIDGKSNRAIAKSIGIDKNTVNKYVKEYDAQLRELMGTDPSQDPSQLIEAIIRKPAYDTSLRHPSEKTQEAVKVIEKCLELNRWKMEHGMAKQVQRASDIYRQLNDDMGINLSYSTVKKLVREMKESMSYHEAYARQEYTPGEACEFDWGEVKLNIGGSGYHKYQMAVFATSYGNYRYGMLFRSQDTAAFQESHVKFFQFCHGIYHTVVYDNMKVAVRKFVGPTEKEPTDALVELSTYYHFNYRFCNVRRGNEKPHVERSVDVVRHAAFTKPGETEFDSLEAANQHLLKVCMKLNKQPLTDGRIPEQTFEEEKPRLMSEMPAMPCFISKINCNVDKYSTVCINNVRYSVPDRYVEKKVNARVYTDKLVFYDNNTIIAEHARSYKQGSYHLDIYHYLTTLKRKPGALPQSTALLQSDTLTKNIYDHYYKNNPKAFLEVLEIIKEKGAKPVDDAIRELICISPSDLSAAKIKVIMNSSTSIEAEPVKTADQLSEKIMTTLSQYDRLREAMNPTGEA